AGWRAAEGVGGARWEVQGDDRRVHERVDQEEVAVRSRDNRPGIPPRVGGVRRVVNPDLVVAEVDHQLDRTARQNPLPEMCWRVRTQPEAVDALVKRRTRSVGTQEHGHGPRELGNAPELVIRLRLRVRAPAHRIEGKDGNPLNEFRVLCNSILFNQGRLQVDKLSGWPNYAEPLIACPPHFRPASNNGEGRYAIVPDPVHIPSGHVGDAGPGADVDEAPLATQRPRAACVQRHPHRFRLREPRLAHVQFRAAGLELAEVYFHQLGDHLAFAADDAGYVHAHRACY